MNKDDIAMEMANCLLIGKPISDDLVTNLMGLMCEEVKKEERERGKTSNSTGDVAVA